MNKNLSMLITGGTGSFGRKFASLTLKKFKIKRLIIFSRDEMKQYEMKNHFINEKNMRFFLGDVRDLDRLKIAFKGVDYIIHGAAIKHVPLAEYNPLECIKTNIYGSSNVVAAAVDAKVKKVIALSTDKAVNPINLYGATKLCAEKIFVDGNAISGKNSTRFSVVRYGNVLSSRGSIIPLIKKIKSENQKHIPLTDEKMTRFFINLEEAVKFVLASFEIMDKGEIFVPKMPSVYIKDLMKTIYPKGEIKIIGIRPGEKIDELLISKDECLDAHELKNGYALIPKKLYFTSALRSKLKKVNKAFEYNSRDNKNFLNSKEFKNLLDK